jgi:UDP-N-acetylmuramoylalanine--D-glutamate ligase
MMKEQVMNVYQNKRVLVLGLAKSGLAAAKLLSALGARVMVNERKPREQAIGVEELEALGIEATFGGHPMALLSKQLFCIVKNPGIPFDIPFLQAAEQKGIPVITEVELAYQLSEAEIIGITGSNGKTTTTTLIYEMLREGPKLPLLAGNIGPVFSEIAAQATQENVLVTELSSFQLLGTHSFKPKIGVFLNIYDAHLDYHHTKAHYLQSKLKLFQNQVSSDIAILNADQAILRQQAKALKGQVVWFSTTGTVSRGGWLDNGFLKYRSSAGDKIALVHVEELKLPGAHNLENALAAATTALEAGADVGRVKEVLRSFQAVPHRLQFVRELKGVKYYNDSKATNWMAAQKGIAAFKEPIVLIAGGLDRQESIEVLRQLFNQQVKGLVTYGQNKSKMADAAHIAGVKEVICVDNVKEAVVEAARLAVEGDVVLLSPAAASWDQFNSFEERGDMFTQSVHMLR